MPGLIASVCSKILKAPGKLITKLVCVFDDIPFLLKGGALPESLESIGSYMLVGAGFITFPIEFYEGIEGLLKGLKLDKNDPKRKIIIETNAGKIALSIAGFGVTTALLLVTIFAIAIAGPLLSLSVPALMTSIAATEFRRKLFNFQLAKKMPDGKEKNDEVKKTKRGLVFSSIYFGLIAGITGLAIFGTLAGLGVASFGIAPSAILIALVIIAVGVKIFQLVDKYCDYKFTDKISNCLNHQDKPLMELTEAELKSTYSFLKEKGLLSVLQKPKISLMHNEKSSDEDSRISLLKRNAPQEVPLQELQQILKNIHKEEKTSLIHCQSIPDEVSAKISLLKNVNKEAVPAEEIKEFLRCMNF